MGPSRSRSSLSSNSVRELGAHFSLLSKLAGLSSLLAVNRNQMPLPKYPNPQFVSSRTQIISRRALQLEHDYADDDSEPDETSLERKDVEDLHAELDKIVSKRLKLKRVLDPSDETPPSKRRKESKPAGHQQGSEPVGKS